MLSSNQIHYSSLFIAANQVVATAIDCARQVARGLLLLLLLLASALSSAQALAQPQVPQAGLLMSSPADATQHRLLGLFRAPPGDFFSRATSGVTPAAQSPTEPAAAGTVAPSAGDLARAQRILHQLWRQQRDDPESLASDMTQLAAYFARQPQALRLLASLEKQPLRLRYRKGEFSTDVRGSAFTVHNVTVNFDPRAAAQLLVNDHCGQQRAHCVASPADALLHELIHAKIALLETAAFIDSGAMQSLIYPHAHEREVINRERGLYAAMSRLDHHPRPQRSQHSGKVIGAACVTCIGG